MKTYSDPSYIFSGAETLNPQDLRLLRQLNRSRVAGAPSDHTGRAWYDTTTADVTTTVWRELVQRGVVKTCRRDVAGVRVERHPRRVVSRGLPDTSVVHELHVTRRR